MTGAGRTTVVTVDRIGRVLSGAGFYLGTAGAARQPFQNSYSILVSRHVSRAAAILKIGIRGATPPPAD